MTASSKLLHAASAKLYDLICAALKTEKGIHIETAITAAGYLTGYELQRASGVDLSNLSPGSPVLNLPGVDDTGPMVMNYIMEACNREGIADSPTQDYVVPPNHKSLQTYLELMQLVAVPHRKIIDELPPFVKMRWLVPAEACVRLIITGKEILPPAIGQSLALEAIVSGAKTVPPRL